MAHTSGLVYESLRRGSLRKASLLSHRTARPIGMRKFRSIPSAKIAKHEKSRFSDRALGNAG